MRALPPLPLPLASGLLRGIAWTRSTRRTAGASAGVMRGMTAHAQGGEGGWVGWVLWSSSFFGDGGVDFLLLSLAFSLPWLYRCFNSPTLLVAVFLRRMCSCVKA